MILKKVELLKDGLKVLYLQSILPFRYHQENYILIFVVKSRQSTKW